MAVIQIFDSSDSERRVFKELEQSHDVTYIDEPLSEQTINEEAEIISVFVSSSISADLISRLPKLRLIACRSTGFNNIAMESAAARDIHVVNVPTYGEHTVAEFAMGLIIALLRNIITDSQQLLTGSDQQRKKHGTDLRGKTLGVVGLGRIGCNVAKLAQAFGMSVIAFDPYQKSAPSDVALKPLDELAKSADVISLHAPLTDDTAHIISADLLSTMRDGVYLINTARGELVDSAALVSALKSGKVAGAALDVLEDESLVSIDEEELLLKRSSKTRESLEHVIENSILMRLPNVILTNHNAYNTVEAITRINKTTLENIKNYLVGNITNEVHV